MLLQPLRLALCWLCDSPRTGCARRTTPRYTWREQAIIDWSWHVISIAACCQCEALRTCRSDFPIATVHLKIGNRRIKIFIQWLFPNILKYKSSIKNSVDFFVSLSLFVIRNFRGTCSSVEMLKGYMVGERLGIPDLSRLLFYTQ